MTLVIPTGFAQAAIEMRSDFDPDSWFITFGVDTSEISGFYEDAAESICQAFEVAWQGKLSSQILIVGCSLTIGAASPPYVNVEVSRNQRGGASAEMLPQNCALLVRKNTGRAGRPGRGRYFLPGVLPEGQVSQTGVISSGTRDTMQDAAGLFLSELADPSTPGNQGTPMVLLHNSGIPGGTTPSPVTSCGVDGTISTQRRRLR